jgi:DNA polymerase-3 subunit delta'
LSKETDEIEFFVIMRLIGQEKIMAFFDGLIERKELARAYCFVGPDQVGKRTAARQIAARLFHTEEAKLDIHPDFCFITRLEDEKTGKLKKDINISQARQLKERIGHKSWFGEYQVVILDEAELLNEATGNALLKILEESKGNTVFFLLTTDDSALLPTVRSRCQVFYFPLVDTEKIEKELLDMDFAGDVAADSARLSWGRPGRAIMLAKDVSVRENYIHEMERWEMIIGQPFHKKLQAVSDLFGEQDDITPVRDRIINAVNVWSVLWRDIMILPFNKSSVSGMRVEETIAKKNRMSGQTISVFLDELAKIRRMLQQNINPRLLVEQMLLRFF